MIPSDKEIERLVKKLSGKHPPKQQYVIACILYLIRKEFMVVRDPECGFAAHRLCLLCLLKMRVES